MLGRGQLTGGSVGRGQLTGGSVGEGIAVEGYNRKNSTAGKTHLCICVWQ